VVEGAVAPAVPLVVDLPVLVVEGAEGPVVDFGALGVEDGAVGVEGLALD